MNKFNEKMLYYYNIGNKAHLKQRAGLAQLVEQRFCKPKVTGSSPVSGTILPQTPDFRERPGSSREIHFSDTIPHTSGASHELGTPRWSTVMRYHPCASREFWGISGGIFTRSKFTIPPNEPH